MNAAFAALLILAAITAIAGLWALITYNRFISLLAYIRDAWAGVQVELKRRYELVPNLVEVVKGYAAHERETLALVVTLRERAMNNHGPADAQAPDEQRFARALERLSVLAEAYPDLKADQHFLRLQRELVDTEDRIAAARRFYNGNVRALNTLARQVPSNIIASMSGIRAQPYFEIDDPRHGAAPGVFIRPANDYPRD